MSVLTSAMADMMRQWILTGLERRRRWSREDKLRILSEVGIGVASVSDVSSVKNAAQAV